MRGFNGRTWDELFVDLAALPNALVANDRRVIFGRIAEVQNFGALALKVTVHDNRNAMQTGFSVWIPKSLEPSGLVGTLKTLLAAAQQGVDTTIYALGYLKPKKGFPEVVIASAAHVWLEQD